MAVMDCIGMGEGCAAIHRTTNRMPAFTIRGCDKGLNCLYVRATILPISSLRAKRGNPVMKMARSASLGCHGANNFH